VISLQEPKLKTLFREYISLYVIGNEHLVELMFLSFCGLVLQTKILYSAKYIYPRISSFVIQDSGSGKSQAMSALYWLMAAMFSRARICKITKTTDAALIGTKDRDKNSENEQSRLLFKRDLILWDEGSVLLRGKNSPHSENLQDIMQMALDEPGYISKATKDGVIEGRTYATIVAGSYFSDEIEQHVLKKGFFQRMFVTRKRFSNNEKREMQLNLHKLEGVSLNQKRDLEAKIKNELIVNYDFDFEKRTADIYKYPGKKYSIMGIDNEASKRFSEKMANYMDEHIFKCYLDNRQQIIETVWSRCRLLTIKVAAQHAFLDKRATILDCDYQSAFDLVVKYHLQSMKNILDSITDEKVVYKSIKKTRQKKFILASLKAFKKQKPNFNNKEFCEYLLKNKSGLEMDREIKIGESGIKTLIKVLEKEKKIKMIQMSQKGAKGKTIEIL